jgi:FxsC-like protein
MGEARATAESGSRGFYFFLSYANKPGPDREDSAPDVWVTRFYTDLSAQVSRLARRGSGLEAGYLAGRAPAAEDWQVGVAAALASAEVFVPLYCRDYLRRSWPLGEWAAFRARMAGQPADRIRGHEQPVLWEPLATANGTPELAAALELGADVPAYAKNGLVSLCRLTKFRAEYAAILRRLAGRVVDAAERAPVGRSTAPISIEVTPPRPQRPSFVIGVIAPTADTLPAGHPTTGYGRSATAWRPYARPESAAQYAAEYAAQQLGLDTDTADLLDGGDPLLASAGIVLIDPWILAVTGGRDRLWTTVKSLPEWVVPFVLANENDPRHARRGETLLAEVKEFLGGRHHAVRCARTTEKFIELTPSVIGQAEKWFLGLAPMSAPRPPLSPPSGQRGMPRLSDVPD